MVADDLSARPLSWGGVQSGNSRAVSIRRGVYPCRHPFSHEVLLMSPQERPGGIGMAYKRRLEGEARARAREEAERQKNFREDLADWRLAQDARRYVAELRVLAEAKGPIEEGSALDKSLRWMEGSADNVDPLSSLRREAHRPAGAPEAPKDEVETSRARDT